MPFQFEVLRQDAASSARFGRLTTAHGVVETPTFMPVGTQGTVKTVSPGELREIGAGVVLGNTYHLYLRPGREVIRQAGGLASFMGWHGPTLTDSGGFQLFSISDLSRVTRDGVTFNSHLDGSLHFFSPEKVVEVGFDIGPDVMMVLDECTRYPVTMDEARRSMDLTLDWAARARARYLELREERTEAEGEAFHPVPFAIVQGSTYAELRHACAERLVGLDFPGFAIGGLGVGEPASARAEMTELTASLLPRDKPRYLMGVGYPEDLFDCVLPTRNARTGWLFTSRGRLVVKNAAYARDFRPPDPGCDCLACRTVSRAYLRHLFNAGEMLAPRMASIHNLRFYLRLMAGMREAIARGEFQRFRADFLARYGNSRREVED